MERDGFIDKVFNMDSVEYLKTLPDNCIDCCVTSPPYFNVRDYNVDGQIGLEETPIQYVDRIVDVFTEVYRVLKPEGTLWLNIGDTYNGTKLGNTNAKWSYINSDSWQKKEYKGCKHKDLLGIPWMVAFALRDRVGFYLRNDIIWAKDNCMPESVTDRLTKSHEHIFLFAKSEKYYFDQEAIMEPCADQNRKSYQYGSRSNGINKDRNDNDLSERSKTWQPKKKQGYAEAGGHRNNYGGYPSKRISKNLQYDGQTPNTMHINIELGLPDKEYAVRNKRDVWHVNTCPDPCAHFAVYPEKLIEPCILAGCPRGGVVLDVFMGSGTTARVAKRFDRHYTGCELNPEYMKIIEKKLSAVQKELFV